MELMLSTLDQPLPPPGRVNNPLSECTLSRRVTPVGASSATMIVTFSGSSQNKPPLSAEKLSL